VKEIAGAAHGTAKQIKAITHANKEHSAGSTRLLGKLRAIRTVAERNALGVKETRGGTGDLLRHAEALTDAVQRTRPDRNGRNGRSGSNGRG
jgi:methyl-accepting chemotaxis protein